MVRWDDLSPAEVTVLETVFWSSGISRAELAELSGFSRSKANTAAAALIERGMIDETGPQASSGGRRPETLLLSAGMGGLLLMAADLGARWLIAPQELPVGVLTAVLGGSYLLWLMHRRSARVSV